jgi:WD40 repeat protein
MWGCGFSPDGAFLATAGHDGTARLWHVATGTPKMLLAGHTGRVRGCAFSPDGSLVATASNDRTARLWDVAHSQEPARLLSHPAGVWACAFSPDGLLLATACADRVVRLWDVASGRCHCALRVSGPLFGISWHPDGTMLGAVGGAGKYLLTYRP